MKMTAQVWPHSLGLAFVTRRDSSFDGIPTRPDHMEHVDTVRMLPTGQTARPTDTSGHPDTVGQVDTTCDPQTPIGPSGNEDLSPPEVTTDTEEMATQGPTLEELNLAESSPAPADPVDDKDENMEEDQGMPRVNGRNSETNVTLSSAATPEKEMTPSMTSPRTDQFPVVTSRFTAHRQTRFPVMT
ncbi:hypothetical protein NP493_675g03053 [Ridgeia piscesae]|uniref:Uncharacterized protein n=1 Tax=Ridgeia piscesae TaxID=27915 RepID=A0AAD9KRX8_RIDPI|nr:hypothetical protein NP493_675g03053 [Ridgeia piscesae]